MITQYVTMMDVERAYGNDRDAWSRTVNVAWRLWHANVWDGKQLLTVINPYAVYQIPVTQLVAGTHYKIESA